MYYLIQKRGRQNVGNVFFIDDEDDEDDEGLDTFLGRFNLTDKCVTLVTWSYAHN